MDGKVVAVTASMSGTIGWMACNRSAEPEADEDARLPCLLRRRSDEARIDDVVEILNVE